MYAPPSCLPRQRPSGSCPRPLDERVQCSDRNCAPAWLQPQVPLGRDTRTWRPGKSWPAPPTRPHPPMGLPPTSSTGVRAGSRSISLARRAWRRRGCSVREVPPSRVRLTDLQARFGGGFGPIRDNLRMLYTGFSPLEERGSALAVTFIPRTPSVLRFVGGGSGRF